MGTPGRGIFPIPGYSMSISMSLALTWGSLTISAMLFTLEQGTLAWSRILITSSTGLSLSHSSRTLWIARRFS